MTSEERLVSQVGKELLDASTEVSQIGEIVVGDNEEKRERPCIVVSAEFQSEETASPLPKRYKLTVALLAIRRDGNMEGYDDAFRAITAALCPDGQHTINASAAPSLESFSWFRIESWEDGEVKMDNGKIDRSRSYAVFASLA